MELPTVFFVFGVEVPSRGVESALRSRPFLDWLLWCLAGTPRTFGPFCACRRLVLRGIEGRLLANLRSDSESTGRFFVNLARDWQILSLLIRANTGSGPQTEHAIDLPVVVSFVQQSLLHPIYIVRMQDRWHFFAEIHS